MIEAKETVTLCAPLDPSGWRSVHARRCNAGRSVLITYDFTEDVHDAFACEFQYWPTTCASGRFRVPTCANVVDWIYHAFPSLTPLSDETADLADLLAEATITETSQGLPCMVFSRTLLDSEVRRLERWFAARHDITLAEAS
jgi:hypothetical protein